MKINRYPAGRSNVEELQAGRRSIRSPEEAAYWAAGPNRALAGAAESIGRNVQAVDEAFKQRDDANDSLIASMDFANTASRLKALRTQANIERWSEEQWNTAVKQEVEAYRGNSAKISERNRGRYDFVYGQKAENLLVESSAEGLQIRTDRIKEEWLASYDALGEAKDYQAQLSMLEIAGQGEGFSPLSKDEVQQLRRAVEGQITAENLMGEYQTAVENGTEDKFLSKLPSMNLTDEAQVAFNGRKAQYDALTQEAQNKVRIEREIDYNNFLGGIDAATPKTTIEAYIRKNPHLSAGHISALYTKQRAREETETMLATPYRDNSSATTRKKFNALLNLDAPPENVLIQGHAIAAVHGTSPEIMSNIIDNYAENPEPSFLMTAGDAVRRYQEDPNTAGVPLPMNERTRAQIEMYLDMVRSKVDPVAAASATKAQFLDVNEQIIASRKRAWDAEDAGSQAGKSPHELISTRLTERLTDSEHPIGQRFIADMGVGWFNQVDNYGDTSVRPSALMERDLMLVAERLYYASGSEEVAINGALNAAIARGYAGTDINLDVPVTSLQAEKGIGKGFEIQMNPITRQGNNIVPRQKVRAEVAKDLEDMPLIAIGQAAGTKARTYSVDEVEIGDGFIATSGPNAGNMQWPLKYMGGTLIHGSGPSAGQPAYFYFPRKAGAQPVDDGSEQPAAAIINERVSDPMRGTHIDLPGVGSG